MRRKWTRLRQQQLELAIWCQAQGYNADRIGRFHPWRWMIYDWRQG